MATLPVSYTSVSLMGQTFSPVNTLIAQINSSAIAVHAGNAEALINAKIARKYTLPFVDTVIPYLQTLATDIAIYEVLSARGALRSGDSDDPWYVRFKDALKTLDDIASGKVSLVDDGGTVLAGRGDLDTVYSNTKNYHQTFWDGPEEDQVTDIDKIEDGYDDRSNSIGDRLL